MRQGVRCIWVALFLILFIGYWSSVTLFPHAHRIKGRVIVHSHITFGASGVKHEHTSQQYQVIDLLSSWVAVACVFSSFLLQLFEKYVVFKMRQTSTRQDVPIRAFHLRAPPVISFFFVF